MREARQPSTISNEGRNLIQAIKVKGLENWNTRGLGVVTGRMLLEHLFDHTPSAAYAADVVDDGRQRGIGNAVVCADDF